MAQAKEDVYLEVIDVTLDVKIYVEESIVTANSFTTVFCAAWQQILIVQSQLTESACLLFIAFCSF